MGMEGEMVAKLIKLYVSKLAFTLCQKIGHAAKIHITNLVTCFFVFFVSAYVCVLQSRGLDKQYLFVGLLK